MSNRYIEAMVSDEMLVKGCLKNDRASQKALYRRFGPKMMMICQRYTRTSEDAEDILQEGFVKVFNHIASFRGDAKLETWMTRIFINEALNHQRQKLYLFPMVDVYETPLAESENISLAGLHTDELLNCIRQLPDGCRIVFSLFAIEGYSHQEIAAMLHISEGTSKSQYSRARTLLMELLTERKPEYGKIGNTSL